MVRADRAQSRDYLRVGVDDLVEPAGGKQAPLVVPAGTQIVVTLNPAHGGARIEVDGQIRRAAEPHAPEAFTLSSAPEYAELVSLGEQESAVAGLRRRRILIDSPRVLARDEREAAAAGEAAASGRA